MKWTISWCFPEQYISTWSVLSWRTPQTVQCIAIHTKRVCCSILQQTLMFFKHYPFTDPAVTPLMMNLLRQRYTTITGRMASRINMYTLPMSNLL